MEYNPKHYVIFTVLKGTTKNTIELPWWMVRSVTTDVTDERQMKGKSPPPEAFCFKSTLICMC